MANTLYDPGREGFLDGTIVWSTGTIKLLLAKTAQAFTASHKFISDLTGANIVQRSGAFASKTVTSGVADAADVTLTSVPAGSNCNVVIYQDTGVDATSRLIAFLDTGSGFPVVTDGADVIISWDNGTNRIFKL